jgi:hypothetical protein
VGGEGVGGCGVLFWVEFGGGRVGQDRVDDGGDVAGKGLGGERWGVGIYIWRE